MKDSVLTILNSTVFGSSQAEGASIGIASGYTGYTLQFASVGTGEGYFTLASGYNSAQKFESDTRTFTGVGASVAGWSASQAAAGSALTYHQEYAQFTFDTLENGLTFADAETVADNVTITGDDKKTIKIGAGAFANLDSGAGVQLSVSSATAGYSLTAETVLTAVQEASWNADNTNSIQWKNKGGLNAGFELGTDSSLMTYWDAQKSAYFTFEGGTMEFASAASSLIAQGIDFVPGSGGTLLAVDASIFGGTPTVSDGAVTFKFTDNTANANYQLTLGSVSDSSLAGGTKQTVESFTKGAYFGQGADTKGYAVDEGGKGITYYGEAAKFTLDGTAAFNDYTVGSGTISDFFNVDGAGVTINSGALNMDSLSQGLTMSIASAKNYSLALGISSAEVTNDTIYVTPTDYFGVGASVAGFKGDDDNKAFTYYEQYAHFALSSLGSNAITFAVGAGSSNAAESVATALTVKDSVITVNDLAIFEKDSLQTNATLGLATGDYSLAFSDDLTLAAGAVHTLGLAQNSTDTTSYTYSFEGADKAGFLASDTAKVFTYYDQAETFSITSGIAFNMASVTSGENFTVGGSNYIVTIGAGALDSNTFADGLRIEVGAGSKSATQYSLYFDTDEDDEGKGDFRLTTLLTANTFTTVSTENDDSITGMFQFKGAYQNGFESVGEDGKVTSYIYHKEADKFSVAGGLSFKEGVRNNFGAFISATRWFRSQRRIQTWSSRR